MPRRNFQLLLLLTFVSLACYEKSRRDPYGMVFSEVMATIEERYYQPIDKEKKRELFESAMKGLVDALPDRHSQFLSPQQRKDLRERTMEQQFVGIGIKVRQGSIGADKKPKPPVIVVPLFNSPAYHAGLKIGDEIIQVDGQATVVGRGESAKAKNLNDVIKMIAGPAGKEVVLTIRRVGEKQLQTIAVERAKIRTESVRGFRRGKDGKWIHSLDQNLRIKYIRLTVFAEDTAQELEQAIRELGEIDALVLDVRGNGGGLLTTAIKICDLFVDDGVIVSTYGRGNVKTEEYTASSRGTYRGFPIAVLVNGNSASASEIVSACLQDHNRAVVVGTQTYGKGSVQNVIPLEGGFSAIKLTTAIYQRPSGKNIDRTDENEKDKSKWGVRPNEGYDVPVEEKTWGKIRSILDWQSFPDWKPEKPVPDPQLNKAVEYLQGRLK